MKRRSLSLLVASFVLASAAVAHMPGDGALHTSVNLEANIPADAEMREAILELADGSTMVVEYANMPDGRAVLNGDIFINVDEDGRATIAKEFDRLWAERAVHTKSTGILGSSFRWPNNTVPFELSVGTVAQENTILAAMQHVEDNSAVRFIPRTTQNDWVDFVNVAGSCGSFVGRQGGRQTIALDPACTFGNTVHEVGHAIGLWHEHQRTDRDNSVTVHWGNIQAGATHNFQIQNGFLRGPFDFNSIMNYGSFFFSNNGQPTLTRLNGSTWVANRTALTATDSTGIGDMYRRVEAAISRSCIGFLQHCDFYGSSTHGVQPTVSWNWTIEDGFNVIRQSGGSVSHTFQGPGPHYVALEVVDSQGDRGLAEIFVDFSGCALQFRC